MGHILTSELVGETQTKVSLLHATSHTVQLMPYFVCDI